MSSLVARRMVGVKPSAIRQLMNLNADPEIVSFGGGYPDASLFPLAEINQVFQSVILSHGRESLQYAASNGILRLREQVASRMARDGVICDAENVLILQGGQQGLDLVAKMFIEKGDIIVTEAATYLGAFAAFNPYEPRYVSVPMDDDGMDMDQLEEVLKQNPGVKMLYTIPDFQNPTGVTMSLERRKKLLELASEFDFIILEDSPYRDIRYEGDHLPPIKSLDTEGRVICLGSFSKILAPGLRLGWAIASDELIEQLGLLKLSADTQCSTLNMSAVSLYLDSYDIEKHIVSIRDVYRRKRDVMLDTIRRTFPSCVSYTQPNGGLFTWLTFPEGFDAGAFMTEKTLPIAKVAYVPGVSFYPVEAKTNNARLSFSTQSDETIVRGITSLARLFTSHFTVA